jgi:hypothetical protein
LGDEVLRPGKNDSKIRFTVSGPVALRMFEYMGSGARSNSCLDEEEARARDKLVCTRNRTTGQAECYFGFDLHSGKSIGGIVC